MNNKFINSFKDYLSINESNQDLTKEFCKEVLRDISYQASIPGGSSYKYKSFTADFDSDELLDLSREEQETDLNFSTEIYITIESIESTISPDIFNDEPETESNSYRELLKSVGSDYSALGDLGISDPYTYKVKLEFFNFTAKVDPRLGDSIEWETWETYNDFNIEIKRYDPDTLSLDKRPPYHQFLNIPGKSIKYSTSTGDPEISEAVDDILQFLNDTPVDHLNEEFLRQ
tara:strand:+ start:883 stop:1575 length:693 start_codon:yes stop_codon:yes gene_type:complete